MSEMRNELLEELEEIRKILDRKHERKEITEDDLKRGIDAIERLKEII